MSVTLTSRLKRITAPNPGLTTGDGTNTYIVGNDRIAIIDPGPAIDSHIEAIIAEVGDRLAWVIVTHTHKDHSPAASVLAARTGAVQLGCLTSDMAFQDESFKPDKSLYHDQLISTDEFTLRAIHTPGHVDNHFCFLLEEDGILMAGDHLMNGSTVVIIPPQGDMKAYIESLQCLSNYPIQAIAPGHGELIENPVELIEWTIAHRLQREQKVMQRLASLGRGVTSAELVSSVYDDVDPSLHSFAEFSLLAHLIKLHTEASVIKDVLDGEVRWSSVPA